MNRSKKEKTGAALWGAIAAVGGAIYVASQFLVDNAYVAFLAMDAITLFAPVHSDWQTAMGLFTLLALVVLLIVWLFRTGNKARRGERKAQRSLFWTITGVGTILILALIVMQGV